MFVEGINVYQDFQALKIFQAWPAKPQTLRCVASFIRTVLWVIVGTTNMTFRTVNIKKKNLMS